jgi:mono/diheme cytochrome c family protein
MRPWFLLPGAALLFACSDAPPSDAPRPAVDAGLASDAGAPDSGAAPEPRCLELQPVDPERAAAGSEFLFRGAVGGRLVPKLAFDNLWLAWTSTRPADPAAAIRERYGFVRAVGENDGLPMGFRLDGSWVRADCLVCHAGEVAGQTVVGAASNRADLELFLDDLTTLARRFGVEPPETPRVRTGARGVSDIVGMTLQLGLRLGTPPTPINTEIGFQDPPAWWTLATKTRIYVDGSGPQTAHRTLMATQLAFGATEQSLLAQEPEYLALREYLLTLEPPPWPFAPPPADAVERGRALFRERCTACHRDDRCLRAESVIVPREVVGTDPERSVKYGEAEIAVINSTWFGADQPHQATAGYQAPSLRGVWASAPYLHNGSVPTLEAVLDSSRRPRFFRVRGTSRADYDEAAVGLKVDVLPSAPADPPRGERTTVYDTTVPGLGNQGHPFGDALSASERADLLHFLKTQ